MFAFHVTCMLLLFQTMHIHLASCSHLSLNCVLCFALMLTQWLCNSSSSYTDSCMPKKHELMHQPEFHISFQTTSGTLRLSFSLWWCKKKHCVQHQIRCLCLGGSSGRTAPPRATLLACLALALVVAYETKRTDGDDAGNVFCWRGSSKNVVLVPRINSNYWHRRTQSQKHLVWELNKSQFE